MNVKSLLGNLKEQGVTLWLEGKEVRIRGTGKPLSPEMFADLKYYKPEIVQILKEEQPKPYLTQFSDLVIPFDSDPRYLWWLSRGMRLTDIRKELKRWVN